MKKLLLVTALLALGATAFGAKEASAPVRVRAEIVSDELTISDIDGRPLLLDFKKISVTQESDANAFVDYKIEYSGTAETTEQDLTLTLGKSTVATSPDKVTLTNIDATLTEKNTMTASLLLDAYSAKVPANTAGIIHTGRINGTLKNTEWKDQTGAKVQVGVYEGQTELSVKLGN